MGARSRGELLTMMADDGVAAAVGRGLVESYMATAFGALPKSEIDLLVFTLLVQSKVLDPNGAVFAVARTLNVTPAKARSLIFQYQLRHVSEADTDKEVLLALTNARYWKEASNIAFGVESPLVRAALAARMREHGVFADVSLSGEILKVTPTQFGEILASLLPSDVLKEVSKKLKKEGVAESAIRKAIKAHGAKIAEGFITDTGKSMLGSLLETVGSGLTHHGPKALDAVIDLVDGLV